MNYTLNEMLRSIEAKLQFVPSAARATFEPLIGAMYAGQVTPVSDEQRHTIHQTFVQHCATE